MNSLVKKIKTAIRDAEDSEDLAYDLVSLLEETGEDAFVEAVAQCLMSEKEDY